MTAFFEASHEGNIINGLHGLIWKKLYIKRDLLMASGGMTIRTIILLTIMLMVSSAAALEPIYIGGGRDGSAVNLDQGARQEGVVPFFGPAGYAAPRSPQPLEVDPGAMVHQSRGYRDATRDLYLKSSEILNQTALLAGGVEQNRIKVDQSTKKAAELQVMAKKSADDTRVSANDSRRSAVHARDYLNETVALCNQTMAAARRMDVLAERMHQIENETRANANMSSESAELARSYLNETRSVHYELNSLAQEAKSLDTRIAWIQSAIQKSDTSL
jgi:hypothetical protein